MIEKEGEVKIVKIKVDKEPVDSKKRKTCCSLSTYRTPKDKNGAQKTSKGVEPVPGERGGDDAGRATAGPDGKRDLMGGVVKFSETEVVGREVSRGGCCSHHNEGP